jgi:catalase
MDFFSQATLFFNSQSEPEQNHLADALKFELGKVESVEIRQRMVNLLTQISKPLADTVAESVGLKPGKPKEPVNHNLGADANPAHYKPVKVKQDIEKSAALSMANTPKNSIQTRQIAFLAADGVDAADVDNMKKALLAAGAVVKVVAPKNGTLKNSAGKEIKIDMSFLTGTSVVFDAVYIPGGEKSIKALLSEPDALHFINEAYRHCKAIAATGKGVELINQSYVGAKLKSGDASAKAGILVDSKPEAFTKAIAQHRFWQREKKDKVLA